MFGEILEALGMQTRGSTKRFDALENELKDIREMLLAETAVLASHGAYLKKILTAVTLPPAVRVVLVLVLEGEELAIAEGESINVKIAINKKGTIKPKLINATGGPGHVDGIPVWPVTVPGVMEFTPAADGLSCAFKTLPLASPDEPKSTSVAFDGDGDMGDGLLPIHGVANFIVYDPAGNTVSVELEVSDVTDVDAIPTPLSLP